MKKNIFLILLAFIGLAFSTNAIAKSEVTTTFESNSIKHGKTTKFKVYGNCGMCKRTIEGAFKNVKAVKSAEWDIDSGEMTVTYNPHKISLDEIKQKIADVGYDTDTHRAKDEIYNNLHGCCQYERPEK